MSAERNPTPDPKSNKDLIQRFNAEYAAALADAQVSAEHTDTEGWQRLYSDHRKAAKDKRRELAERMRKLATATEDFGLTEDGEKALKAVAKESEELRGLNAVFEAETIERVCAPVKACERLIEGFRNDASRQERDAPLHNVGLEHLMRDAIAKQPKASWDAENGRVVIEAAST